jgi:hypothetical protein
MSWDPADGRFAVTVANVTYDLDPLTAATSIVIPGAGTFNATYSLTRNVPIAKTVTIAVTVTNVETNRRVVLTSLKRLAS